MRDIRSGALACQGKLAGCHRAGAWWRALRVQALCTAETKVPRPNPLYYAATFASLAFLKRIIEIGRAHV